MREIRGCRWTSETRKQGGFLRKLETHAPSVVDVYFPIKILVIFRKGICCYVCMYEYILIIAKVFASKVIYTK